MKKIQFLVILFIAVVSISSCKRNNGGEVSVSGIVTYQSTGNPVPNADIIWLDATCNCGTQYPSLATQTDSTGFFQFSKDVPAEYTGMDNINTYYVYAEKDSIVCIEGKYSYEIQRKKNETYNFTIPD